jgi:Domain of unknown function (DUF4157)
MEKLMVSNKEARAAQPKGFFVQPKLTINQPNDVHEQEADAMADKVMRMEQPGMQLKPLSISTVQRKCTHCEDEEKAQRKEMNEQETHADANLENYVGKLGSSGTPLSNKARNFYEPRFGYDFSQVKIHTDTVAAKSAQSINALAYTSGNNIVFNQGQFSPDTDSGKRLLGHELTHVVQQSKSIQLYRTRPENDKTKDKRKSFNFGKRDDVSLGLVEDSFNKKKDIETKPWIELVEVKFTKIEADADGIKTWMGTADVKYYDNKVKQADFSFQVTGGSTTLGKTDPGTKFIVTRIEGIGYNSGKYSGSYKKSEREGPSNRYSVDLSANMSYAVFYNGGEALHVGPLEASSHGCVHVDWVPMKQLNYHSVIGLTKVHVSYP